MSFNIPADMPEEAKQQIIGLLGSTYGEMKRLDGAIISTSQSLNHRGAEMKNTFEQTVKEFSQPKPSPATEPVIVNGPPLAAQRISIPQLQEPVLIPSNYQPSTSSSTTNEQILFDFDRAAKYSDVVDALNDVVSYLKRLEKRLDSIENTLNVSSVKPKKKDG